MSHRTQIFIGVVCTVALTVVATTFILKDYLPGEAKAEPPPKPLNVIDENGTTVFGANSANVAVTNFPAANGGSSVFTLFGVDTCPGGSVMLSLGEVSYIEASRGLGGVFCNVGVLVPGEGTPDTIQIMGDCVVCQL